MYPPVEVYTHLHLPQVGLRPLQLIRSRVPGILPPRQEATIHPVKHSQARSRILFCIIVNPHSFRLDKVCRNWKKLRSTKLRGTRKETPLKQASNCKHCICALSLDPRDNPRPSPSGHLSGLGKSLVHRGWISQ